MVWPWRSTQPEQSKAISRFLGPEIFRPRLFVRFYGPFIQTEPVRRYENGLRYRTDPDMIQNTIWRFAIYCSADSLEGGAVRAPVVLPDQGFRGFRSPITPLPVSPADLSSSRLPAPH